MKYLVWLLVFFAAVGIQLLLESLNVVDSIGFWYTAYSAAINTVLLFAAFVVTRFALRKIRGGKPPRDKEPGPN